MRFRGFVENVSIDGCADARERRATVAARQAEDIALVIGVDLNVERHAGSRVSGLDVGTLADEGLDITVHAENDGGSSQAQFARRRLARRVAKEIVVRGGVNEHALCRAETAACGDSDVAIHMSGDVASNIRACRREGRTGGAVVRIGTRDSRHACLVVRGHEQAAVCAHSRAAGDIGLHIAAHVERAARARGAESRLRVCGDYVHVAVVVDVVHGQRERFEEVRTDGPGGVEASAAVVQVKARRAEEVSGHQIEIAVLVHVLQHY